MLKKSEILRFQKYIYRFFDQYGRHNLPWRLNYDPYRIMVSEIMLQQTQVDRVIPKFEAFIKKFPTPTHLAQAPVGQVISAWQGLGYNRRGLNLQRAAIALANDFKGKFPNSNSELLSLPGIGPYTASAIQVFAFNQPSVVIETNIRTVFIFHFFHGTYKVEDQDLITIIEASMDRENPRKWYSALMDYGAHLKKVLPNPSRQSKTYAKQSKLAGSNREARGKVLKILVNNSPVSLTDLIKRSEIESSRIEIAVTQLIKEGFIKERDGTLHLAETAYE